MTDIQQTRLNKLNSNHPVRVREYRRDAVVVIIESSPRHHEFSIYTILPSGKSVDFFWFRSEAYRETFKALPTLKEFQRRLA